mmetsp:Transcript_16556/g.33872  ORF Transcript_16556/g.33872 Transcript_16556/m.33872 type:complete len:122 (-) Transcript_16556:2131-2496(-)
MGFVGDGGLVGVRKVWEGDTFRVGRVRCSRRRRGYRVLGRSVGGVARWGWVSREGLGEGEDEEEMEGVERLDEEQLKVLRERMDEVRRTEETGWGGPQMVYVLMYALEAGDGVYAISQVRG